MDRVIVETSSEVASEVQETPILKFKESAANFDSKMWVVASGKGGVGKTFVSSSMGITLAKLGHSVVIVDLDLSGANVHTALGLDPAHTSIRNFFDGSKSLADVVLPTNFPRLSYVQGFWDSWSSTDFTMAQITSLIGEIRKLKAGYVIVDLGAGAQECHLELFNHADEKLLVSSPEPTSIEKSYRFIESYVCHALKEDASIACYDNMIQALRQHRQRTLGKSFSFRSYLKDQPGVHLKSFEKIMKNPVRLLINSSRSSANQNLGHSMKSVCNKYYDLSIDYLGHLDFDNAVWQSVSMRESVLLAQPFTPLAGQFLETCKHLIDPKELRAVV